MSSPLLASAVLLRSKDICVNIKHLHAPCLLMSSVIAHSFSLGTSSGFVFYEGSIFFSFFSPSLPPLKVSQIVPLHLTPSHPAQIEGVSSHQGENSEYTQGPQKQESQIHRM